MEPSMIKTTGTVSTYQGLFRYFTLIGNVMVGQGICGKQLIVSLREVDYAH